MGNFSTYTSDPHRDRDDWHNIRRMMPLLWDYRGRALLAVLFLVLAKMANVGVPLVLKDIVDALDNEVGRELALPVTLLVAYGLLKLGASLFNELRDAIFARVRFRAMRQLSVSVLRHLHNLSLRYHLERKTGAITRDLERGTRSVSNILNYAVFQIFPTTAEFLLVGTILFSKYDPIFALITFGSVIAYVGFTVMVTEWRMHYRHEQNRLDSESNTQAVDSLINYETVKYFNNEELEVKRFDNTLDRWEMAAVNSYTSMTALNFGQGAIIALGVAAIMTFAAQGVVDGSMTLGDLVLVNALMLQLFIPLNALGIVYRQIKYLLADMDLMFKLLDTDAEIKDRPDAADLNVSKGEIHFKAVDFAYNSERPILKGVDLHIHPGQTVAVVGHSGAGKSTLARLLYRFYDTSAGQVLIDGQSVADVSQSSLRQAIGIVPQDTVLFNDSLYYNLAYARPEAGRDEIIEAAKLAHIHDFIESLPQGYDTVVGERGLKLSGGEKQRVAIARAIVKQPKILVFDEATSSLDSRTEQSIQGTLQAVASGHTTLVIAHRLSTIVDADLIVVMDAGRIVESGTHRALLEKKAVYAQMWALQQEEPES